MSANEQEPENRDREQDQRIADLPGTLPFIITEQVGGPAAPAAPPPPAAPIVSRELRNILSFVPSADDLEGTERALGRAFETVVEDGITKVIYAPGGPSVPIERVEVTGAQGSIYARARSALDDMLPILDQLEPMLEETADDEAVAAIRAIVRSELTQIVEELGTEGGPTVLLVDGLWAELLGVEVGQPSPTYADRVRGNLGELRERFYFKREYIANIPDEENYTRFLTLVEHAVSLYQSWLTHRPYFTGRRAPEYFGPLVVQLRRTLQTVSDDVDEATSALDAVNIGHAERQLLRVHYKGAPLYLQATLDWIQRFVTEEAPHLIDAAGKDGAIALYPTLWAMAEAVEEFVPPVPGFPTLYGSPLVRAAMASLAGALDEAVRIVDRIGPPPTVQRVLPRRQPRPGEAIQPEEPLPPQAELEAIIPARTQKVMLGLGFRGARRGQLEALRQAQFFLRHPETGKEFPGVFVDQDEAVLFYEFDLSGARIAAPRQSFELWLVVDGQRRRTDIDVPISP